MILYHGSVVPVEEPRILASFRFLDFGQGFYTTRSYEQAERWARTKMKREGKEIGYVSVYEFDDAAAKEALQIREFFQADAQWLHFVVNNRRGTQELPQADIDIGPVAEDNVYASIRLFETNVLDEDETIKRLKTEVLHDQITFHTDAALAFCKLVEVREIREAT